MPRQNLRASLCPWYQGWRGLDMGSGLGGERADGVPASVLEQEHSGERGTGQWLTACWPLAQIPEGFPIQRPDALSPMTPRQKNSHSTLLLFCKGWWDIGK